MTLRTDVELLEIPFTVDQLKALDAWRAKHKDAGLTRVEAIRHLVHSALYVHAQQELAKSSIPVDEGLRPEQLTSENDA